MDYKTYLNKVKGCFLGKTIGGTLGAPFECFHGLYNLTFFQQDVSKPVPNDDVDLQLVWLYALENEGKNVDSEMLARYWASNVYADFCEYGVGKNNYAAGILPPLSGHLRNENRDSNGAWIRSEIWACVTPGNPYLAAYYAYQDSSVDHSGEGIYASVFLAVLESVAFFEKDVFKLTDIALSFIPSYCEVAQAVKEVIKCYEAGKSFLETRKVLFTKFPSAFGGMNGNWGTRWKTINGVTVNKEIPVYKSHPFPEGEHGHDAPCHMGIIMMGWLYGKGDFAKSICLAADLGEDTDCTAGTLGAILGIIMGADKLPKKWVNACSPVIATCTIVNDWKTRVPKDINELTRRIGKVMPSINDLLTSVDENGLVTIKPFSEIDPAIDGFKYRKDGVLFLDNMDDPVELLKNSPNTVRKNFSRLRTKVIYDKNFVRITENQKKEIKVELDNQSIINHYAQVKLLNAPSNWVFEGGNTKSMSLAIRHGSYFEHVNQVTFSFIPQELKESRYDLVVEISYIGEGEKYYIPVVLFNGNI